MPSRRVIRTYTDETDTQYLVVVPVTWTLLQEGALWANTGSFPDLDWLPRNIHMRRLHLVSADGLRHRQLPIDWLHPGWWPRRVATITLPNIDGSTTDWTCVGRTAERVRALVAP